MDRFSRGKAHLAGALNLRERIRRGEPIGLTDVVLTELLQGVPDAHALARLEGYLAVCEVARLESSIILPGERARRRALALSLLIGVPCRLHHWPGR